MRHLSRLGVYVVAGLVALSIVSSGGAVTHGESLLRQIRSPAKQVDAEMVKELGADNLGMRKYVMAFLKSGPKRDQDADAAAKIQEGHMANIGRLAKEGKLILAGPFMDNGDIRGIYVFNTDSLDEAKQWTATDPAIQAGRLEMELHPWYGSAAMLLLNDLHSRVQPKQ